MKNKVSIIVPVYNVKDYLDACVSSAVRQTYSDIEIILVDDGSTDGSGQICDNYALNYDNVMVIHKANGGLSSARNAGIDVAKGEFLLFLDGDDYLEEDATEVLVRTERQTDADIVQGQFGNGESLQKECTFHTTVCAGKEAFLSENWHVAAWAKLYKREVWGNLRFTEGIIHEDYDIMYRLVYNIPKIAMINKRVYIVNERPGSITRSVADAKKYVLISIDEDKIKFYQEQNDEKLLDMAYTAYYGNLLTLYKIERKREIKRKFRKNIERFLRIRGIPMRTKVKLVLCYVIPSLW